ncbi:MAG TPA: hypothetical protein VFV10_15840, partial [Gammaproteobacteria bacterium]|nr:hypothetical protein [Gammaproteobacteria bacterium]
MSAEPTPAKRKVVHGPGRPDKYLDANGKRVPGTTTITDRFGDKSALILWAHKQGLAAGILHHVENPLSHVTLQNVEAGKELCATIARRTLNEARDQAADAGTIVHQWIRDFTADREQTTFAYSPDELVAQAERSFAAFREWAERVQLEIVATEIPLVHSTLGYGGTLDAIGLVSGRLLLLDWKSGNRTYPEHLVQQA